MLDLKKKFFFSYYIFALLCTQDIYDGKVSLVLGLLWNMIQNFQFHIEPEAGSSAGMTATIIQIRVLFIS